MIEAVATSCYACKKPLGLPAGNIGRSESCINCRADVRVCKNCIHYDTRSYNECREPSAERVVDKEKRNFCDYFSLSLGNQSKVVDSKKEDALKKLDDLFKK